MFTSWDALNDGYLELEQITPKNRTPWKSTDDFAIMNITYYPAGTDSLDDCFKSSEWDPNVLDNGQVSSFGRREVMPSGVVRNAFDYIPLP